MAENEESEVNQTIGGSSGSSLRSVKAGLKVDVESLKKVTSEFDKLSKTIDKLKKDIPELVKQVSSLATALGSAGEAGGTVQGPATKDSVSAKHNTLQTRQAQYAATALSGGGMGGIGGALKAGFSAAGGAKGVTGIATQMATSGVQMMDRRIDRGAQYSLSADRMNMLYQQMTGMSQQAVQDAYRQPLTNYRIGRGGVNQLLSLQAETGINAQQQASSVEAIRAISGFSLGTGDVSNMLATLGSAQVTNRMFMMTGQSLYGFGGTQNTGMSVMQNLVTSAGLTDPRIAESAMQQGSVSREKLRMMGVPEDMITTVLQYAQQNLAFKDKGGQGMYDPSKREHTKLMGVEDNFATQAEETDRVRMARDEQFYSRQADNYAQLEKTTQSLERAFGALEDKLSGIIGARTSTRGFQRIAGRALQGIGAITAAATGVTGVGAAVGLGVAALGTAIVGDGEFDTGTSSRSSNLSNIMVPHGYGGNKKSITDVQATTSFKKLNNKFAERLTRMMRDNPNVGVGQGWRDPKQQETMFFDRYQPTDEETKLFWNGKYWKHVKGAAAAPPGRSMHEIGLAADLVGDLAWVQANAHKYGLKTFAGVNDEPWHVQPAELPNSRTEYERSGAPWGTDPYAAPLDESHESDLSEHADTRSLTANSLLSSSTGGINELLQQATTDNLSRLYSMSGRRGNARTGNSSSSSQSANSNYAPGSGGALAGEQVAQLAYDAGFRGNDLVTMLAIAKRESNWRPGALNPNAGTEDLSFGLWQINMIGDLGPWRKDFFAKNGLQIGEYTDLYDPRKNAKAAKILYDHAKKNRDSPFHDWGGYKNVDPTYNTNMGEAAQIVSRMNLSGSHSQTGDPASTFHSPPSRQRSGGGGGSVVVGGDTYHISPVINLSTSGSFNNSDLHRIAQEVSHLIERNVKVGAMRRY